MKALQNRLAKLEADKPGIRPGDLPYMVGTLDDDQLRQAEAAGVLVFDSFDELVEAFI